MSISKTSPSGKLSKKALAEETPRQVPPPNASVDLAILWQSIVNDYPPEHFRVCDRGVLTTYCELEIRLRRIRRDLETAPLTVENNVGTVQANPLLAIESRAVKDSLAYARALRITPSTRLMANQVPKSTAGDHAEVGKRKSAADKMKLQLVE